MTPSEHPISSSIMEVSNLLGVNLQTLAFYLDLLEGDEQEQCKLKFRSDPTFKKEIDKLERLVLLYNNGKLDGPERLMFEEAMEMDNKLRDFVHNNLIDDYLSGSLDEQAKLALEKAMQEDENLRSEILDGHNVDVAFMVMRDLYKRFFKLKSN